MSHSALKIDDDHLTPVAEGSIGTRASVRSAFPDATGGSVMDWQPMFDRYRAKTHKYPIWSAMVDGRPLEVAVHFEGHTWVAENAEYDISAFGGSISEALSESEEAIRYLFNELVSEPDEVLTEYARLLKSRYSRITLAPLP